jgi:hypothetical protein
MRMELDDIALLNTASGIVWGRPIKRDGCHIDVPDTAWLADVGRHILFGIDACASAVCESQFPNGHAPEPMANSGTSLRRFVSKASARFHKVFGE